MVKGTTATVADETADVKEGATEEQINNETVSSGITQAEGDALGAIMEGVGGTLTPNTPIDEEVQDDDSKSETSEEQDATTGEDKDETTTEANTGKPAPQLEEEKDDAGLYNQPVTEDPGEFKPSSYDFEITTTDGKNHKITNLQDAEDFAAQLDEKPELISASQFMALGRKTAVMERGLADDQTRYEAQKQQYETEQANSKQVQDNLVQWNNELNYLANGGDIPKISDAMNQADWQDSEVAKDPAVAARLEIFKWMEGENNKRIPAGLEPIRSVIDAHNAMQLETLRKTQTDEGTQEKETRQKRGSMVGGAAPSNPQNHPANSIIGEGGSLDDLVTEYFNQ